MLSTLSTSVPPPSSTTPTPTPTAPSSIPRTLPLPRRPSNPRRATSPPASPPPGATPRGSYIHLPPVDQLLRTNFRAKGSKSQGSSPLVGSFGKDAGAEIGMGMRLPWDLERALLGVEGTDSLARAQEEEEDPLERARRASGASPLEPLPLPFPSSSSPSGSPRLIDVRPLSLPLLPPPLPNPPPPALTNIPRPNAEAEGEAFDFEPFVAKLDLVAAERARVERREEQGAEEAGKGKGKERLLPEFEEFVRESFQLDSRSEGGERGGRSAAPPPPNGGAADDSPRPRPPPLPPLMTPSPSTSTSLPFPSLSSPSSSVSLLGPFPPPNPNPNPPRISTTSTSASYQSFDLIDFATPAPSSSAASPQGTGRRKSLAATTTGERGSGRTSLRIEIPEIGTGPGGALLAVVPKQDDGADLNPPFLPSPSSATMVVDQSLTRYQLEDVGVTPIEEKFPSSAVASIPPPPSPSESEEEGGSEDFEGFEYAASNISGYEEEGALEEKGEGVEEEDVTLHSSTAVAAGRLKLPQSPRRRSSRTLAPRRRKRRRKKRKKTPTPTPSTPSSRPPPTRPCAPSTTARLSFSSPLGDPFHHLSTSSLRLPLLHRGRLRPPPPEDWGSNL
ncbi:hypothetical protein BCR35DRAFT_4834 [Leucosporidium creatinivorum]|uniref:Uncharacterized protein n=1 Tax=Leucosporidium creatinivorum TaxID=106004 RepID=A0A1Y2G3W2_9BASI|nr:hypothetical protein BCR35DRAFT_4834 [Leucosporidium creatinivorum]